MPGNESEIDRKSSKFFRKVRSLRGIALMRALKPVVTCLENLLRFLDIIMYRVQEKIGLFQVSVDR